MIFSVRSVREGLFRVQERNFHDGEQNNSDDKC